MKVKELIACLQGMDDHGVQFDQEAEVFFCDGAGLMEVLSIYPDGNVVVVDIG